MTKNISNNYIQKTGGGDKAPIMQSTIRNKYSYQTTKGFSYQGLHSQ